MRDTVKTYFFTNPLVYSLEMQPKICFPDTMCNPERKKVGERVFSSGFHMNIPCLANLFLMFMFSTGKRRIE